MPFATRVIWSILSGLAMVALPPGASADPNLGKLECAAVTVQLNEGAKLLGVGQEDLRNALLAELGTQVPRLRLDDVCFGQATLYLSVILHTFKTESEVVAGYFGTIRPRGQATRPHP